MAFIAFMNSISTLCWHLQDKMLLFVIARESPHHLPVRRPYRPTSFIPQKVSLAIALGLAVDKHLPALLKVEYLLL